MAAKEQIWPIAPGELPRDGRLTAELQQYNPRLVLLSGATINRAGGLIRPALVSDARREAIWWRFPGANGYIDLGTEYLVAHNAHTLISVHECSALTANFGLLTSYQTAVATRMSLFYSSDASYSDISVGEAGGGGTAANRQRFTLATGQTRTSQRHSMVMRRAGDGQHAMWINGVRLTASNGNSFASPTGNSVIGNASPGSLANDWQGRIFAFVLLDGLLPDDLAQSISAQPAAMFDRPSIWDPGSAGGGVDLVVPEAAHAHAADSLTLTTATTLAVADALHSHAADALTLQAGAVLVVSDGAHGHTADALALSTQAALAVADATHGHFADGVVLSVAGATNLTLADATHAHTVDGLTLTAASVLTIQEALHAHAADSITLDAGAGPVLLLADGLHAHTSDGMALTVAAWLVVSEARHLHGADNVFLTFGDASIDPATIRRVARSQALSRLARSPATARSTNGL